jgi:3-hydroxyisobutyrate dehydrogenase-like beta-hydroxyacid dehydrogenase
LIVGDTSAGPICGFVGLGSQGAPIARRMAAAGFSTLLWARRPETLQPFRASSAKIVGSLEELAAGAEHVGVCVTDDAVSDICGRLLPAMRRGARIVIHSTTLPETCRRLAEEAAEHGVAMLEAPVSGGPPAAEAGALTVMTAGDAEVLAAARPILETFSGLILHLGPHGAAQSAKLVNNTLLAANLGVADQALAAGACLGLDRAALLELLMSSSGRSFALQVLSRHASLGGFANGVSLADKARLLDEAASGKSVAVAGLRRAASLISAGGDDA